MAPESDLLILGINDEGYYRKFFKISPDTNLKKLLDAYRANLCTECTKPIILDFWFDTIAIRDGHTARALGMTNGDVIDIHISLPVTRGACPLPGGQTTCNIHYLPRPARVRRTAGDGIQECQAANAPDEPTHRIWLTVKDYNGSELTLRIKKTTPFKKVLDAYAYSAARDAHTCRLYLDGVRLTNDMTPEEVDMEQGDLIEVHWEQTGGAALEGRVSDWVCSKILTCD